MNKYETKTLKRISKRAAMGYYRNTAKTGSYKKREGKTMLTIKAISNNKKSVRVYNHAAKYSKTDLLAYANNVNDALFADIRIKNGYSILTHKINENGAKIRHNAPDKKRHKIFVDRCIDECGDGFEICINDDEYYNNIIAFGNDDYIVFNKSEYGGLFDTILTEIKYNCYYIDTVNAIKNGETTFYNDVVGCAADIFSVAPDTITETNAIKIYDVLQSFYNSRIVTERETIAAILTELTPFKWCSDTIRGYCQGDYQFIVYPDTYGDAAISDFETFYFGKYQDYIIKYRGETVSDFIPDHIAWNENELNARILELTRDYLTADKISAADIVYNFDV